ncbi:MAG TPA: serine/threonine-protein kinase [Vicinamibacterales bacterium]
MASTSGGGAPAEGGSLQPGLVFGKRYHVIRLLGTGGMGAVYQAWDQELSVAVAIKVIRPEVMADPVVAAEIERRFKRELLLAREVTHKNVVRIHDLGEIDGIKYITMKYVNGADLATVLKAHGKLSVARTLRIARGAISGLVAAHGSGIVHRDLKPANVMIDGDEALIMDFGIARSMTEAIARPALAGAGLSSTISPSDTTPEGTAIGAIVGTVEYMAPEQAHGLPVDQRADVYAFGLILYDMLVGRRRIDLAGNALVELQQRIEQAPPPPRSVAPDVPEALSRIVAHCIEPDPQKRFQSTLELEAALDRLDENGEPIPVRRVFGMPVLASIVLLALALLGGSWWYASRLIPVAQHDPVSVLIADLNNTTQDPAFDRTLEPMLKLALEGAGFISAYDHSAISRSLGVKPPEKLDERSALELAVKQGLGVVVSGKIEPQRGGYELTLKAAEAVTGNVLTTASGRAAGKDQVLATATRLAASVRQALGDETSESAQRFATQTFTATSLEVVRAYATGAEALSRSRFDEAFQSFSKSVSLDPNFGLGYAGMGIAASNLDKQQDAQTYIKEAVRHLDGMTERERYRTRGLFYMLTNDYPNCVKEYGDLIARYAADAPARNNLALCLSHLREMPRAVAEMQQVVKILPQRRLYHENLALYAAYSGDYQTAEQEARSIDKPGFLGLLPVAFAQLLQNQVQPAIATYKSMTQTDAQGASYTIAGLADIALYEGRFSEAADMLKDGAAADLASKDPDRAANKLVAMAYAELLRQKPAAATAAADRALAASSAVKIRFLAGRIFVEAGDAAKARALSAGLASELQAEPQAYAKIIEGEIALKNGEARQAIKAFTDSSALLDTWMSHFDLGKAYLAASAFTQADSEFDRCLARKGEVLALFLDEEPTYGHLPQVFYYQGRAREGLNTSGFVESYRTYLAIRGQSKEDPLLPEVRRRAAGG